MSWTVTESAPRGGISSVHALSVAADNSVYFAGARTLTSSRPDVIVRRLHPNGEVLWTQFHDGGMGQEDLGHALVVDGFGDVVVAGSSRNLHKVAADAWIHRYSARGEQSWTEWIRGAEHVDSSAYGLAYLEGGDLIVVGSLSDYVTSESSIFVHRLTNGAEPLDLFTLAAAEPGGLARARAVAITEEQRILVVGADTGRVWLGALSPNLTAQWTAEGELGEARGVTALADKTAVVVGENEQGAFVRKFDPNDGAEVWTREFDAAAAAIIALSDDELLVAGRRGAPGSASLWLAHLSSEGEVFSESDELLDGARRCQAQALAQAPDHTIVVGGDCADSQGESFHWVQRRG